jgi:hypothetical protein
MTAYDAAASWPHGDEAFAFEDLQCGSRRLAADTLGAG